MVLEGAQAVFWAGCGGGALAELFHWWGLRATPQLPAYAKSPLYWIVTIAMVFAGGLVAWLYFGARAEAIIAAHVGISAPLILQKLATSIPDTKGGRNVVATPAPSIRRFFTW
jgi:hypothetical protein